MHLARMGPFVGMVMLSASVLGAAAVRVPIDVKPGDTPTTVEANRGGFLPVAILSTGQFDALTVEVSTIRIGPTGTEAEAARSMRDDVNRDGRTDLQVLVRVQDLKITCSDKTIRMTAQTMDGVAIEGSEDVTVEGCK